MDGRSYLKRNLKIINNLIRWTLGVSLVLLTVTLNQELVAYDFKTVAIIMFGIILILNSIALRLIKETDKSIK